MEIQIKIWGRITMSQYRFLGKLSIKKHLTYALSSYVISIIVLASLVQKGFLLGFILFSIVYSLIIIEIFWRKNKSVAELTEYSCVIIETKFFGLIRIKKKMDIDDEEKETLKEYFKFISSNPKGIQTFSISSLNKLVDESIKFKNFNFNDNKSL